VLSQGNRAMLQLFFSV